jgi:glucose/arabinose dehydrogenase
MNFRLRPLGAVFACLLLLLASSALRAAEAPKELTVPDGFAIEIIAHVQSARELAAAPNGDLFVGTAGNGVMIVPDAEGATPGTPTVFARINESPDAGVALGPGYLYIGTQFGVWRVPYTTGQRSEGTPSKIATVRPAGSVSHSTTSVAFSNGRLYAAVGSSCNACTESDPTRATIQEMDPDGRNMHVKARKIRNAIALAVNPATGAVWAGVAGQDELEHGHPYEIFDPFTLHPGTLDYGWPNCYDNHKAKDSSLSCADQIVPRVVFPGYITPIGAAIYPLHHSGKHAFPRAYLGGAFVGLHGSWHRPLVAPRVAFVPLRGDEPASPVDWNDPAKQWRGFVEGFQRADDSRVGRPTGIAIGPEGSLFVADDSANVIYRIRPEHR